MLKLGFRNLYCPISELLILPPRPPLPPRLLPHPQIPPLPSLRPPPQQDPPHAPRIYTVACVPFLGKIRPGETKTLLDMATTLSKYSSELNAAFLVLGTFITEWDEGRASCDVLLSTKESAQMYAERLAELAPDLGFHGWLMMSMGCGI